MAEIDHSSRQHALLSASGSSRWLNCTPSARLEEKYQTSEVPTIYAKEGTVAHELGDIHLRYFNREISKSVFQKEYNKIKKNELHSSDMDFEVQKYVDYVIDIFETRKEEDPETFMQIEEKVDYSYLVEKGFGTGDASIISNTHLDIGDLKYGRGVKVDALNNSQLRLYALGSLRALELSYDIQTVTMHIIQPRLNNYSTETMEVADLITWAEDFVRPRAEKAFAGKGIKVAGEWCKFCKVKAMCETYAAENMKLARFDFKDPDILTDDEIFEIYNQQPMLQDWVKGVSEYVLQKALRGKQWHGLKLVEGRSNRKWLDEVEVMRELKEMGYKKSEISELKLKNLTTIEKMLGKEDFDKISDLIIKPPGAPTLTDINDKRPGLGTEQAKLDFAD